MVGNGAAVRLLTVFMVAALVGLGIASPAWAVPLGTYEFNQPGNKYAATDVQSGLTFSNFNLVGVWDRDSSANGVLDSKNWHPQPHPVDRYLGFSMTSSAPQPIVLDRVDFKHLRLQAFSAGGPTKVEVRTSIDEFATVLDATVFTTPVIAPKSAFVDLGGFHLNVGQTMSVRFYGYSNAANSGGGYRLRDVQVQGDLGSILAPEPLSMWLFCTGILALVTIRCRRSKAA